MATQRKLSYREFADGLEEAFESLAHGDEDEIVVEKAGRLYRLLPSLGSSEANKTSGKTTTPRRYARLFGNRRES